MSTKSRLTLVITVTLLIGLTLFVTNYKQRKDNIKPAFDGEFFTRPDCYEGLLKHYDLNFTARPMQMEPGLMYKALADGAIDIIDGYGTDGRIPAYDLVILKDDRKFFPPYYAAPVVRNDTLQKYPQLKNVLNILSGKFSDEAMQQMNYAVDRGGKKPEDVALEYLLANNILPGRPQPNDGSRGTVVIGGKNHNEQEILGHMLAYLVEHHTDLKTELKLNLGGTMIVFNALKSGDIDLYPEYTGTGLVNILKEEVITDPHQAYNRVKDLFQERYNLVWLEPFGFNNSYVLAMRRQQAEQMNIISISDLSVRLNKR